MKIYIPFNSHDFNSVLTTLSISPAYFYPNRNYSFKRSTSNLIWSSEFNLIGFKTPIFHTRQTDVDDGFIINLEIDDNSNLFKSVNVNDKEINYCSETIYLLDNFKFIFRTKDELNEVFSRTLKSIETKFTALAKHNSIIATNSNAQFINDIPFIQAFAHKPEFDLKSIFLKERKLNKIWGAITGSIIGINNDVPSEFIDFKLKLKSFKNTLTIYLNNLQNGQTDRSNINAQLKELKFTCNKLNSVEQAIIFGCEGITATEISKLNSVTLFGVNIYNLLINGLFHTRISKLPLPLQLEKFERILNSTAVNSKYISSYISKILSAFDDLNNSFQLFVDENKSTNKIQFKDLIQIKYINEAEINISIPNNIDAGIRNYFQETLFYFLDCDYISNVDSLFENREELLSSLGKHFLEHIKEFKDSYDITYLRDLYDSFRSLRSNFNVSDSNNDVIKTIAILFTSGRDLLQFVENCNHAGISPIIYYSIWGCVYGAASLPKTLTEAFLNDDENILTLIKSYKNSIGLIIENTSSKNDSVISKEENNLMEPNSSTECNDNTPILSQMAEKILRIIETNGPTELKNLKEMLKAKNQNEILNIVNTELSNLLEEYNGKPKTIGKKRSIKMEM